jgi:hypothetical protein
VRPAGPPRLASGRPIHGFPLTPREVSPALRHELIPPLDAYRADIARLGEPESLSASDGTFLMVATALSRLAARGRASALASLEMLGTQLRGVGEEVRREVPADPIAGSLESLGAALAGSDGSVESNARALDAVRRLVEYSEEAGALLLTARMLADAQAIFSPAPPAAEGHILLQQARVARTLGDFDAAATYYAAAERLAEEPPVPSLAARATIGRAVLARIRGNYPEARVLFERARETAERAGLTDLAGAAHQGLMIAAAVARDFDTALAHGWAAFRLAGDDARRHAEVLSNLSQVCLDAGYPRAAAQGHLRLLASVTAPRFRLPALAGLILAAGRMRDVELLAQASRAIRASLSEAFPYESARALEAAWRAQREVNLAAAAEESRRDAKALAVKHGFFEILYAVEREPAGAGTAPAPCELTPTSRAVVVSLEDFPVDAAVLVSLSGTTD